MDVKIYFNDDSPYGQSSDTLKNITEIHYNYSPDIWNEPRIAFESDIEQTGYTYQIKHIREFEAK